MMSDVLRGGMYAGQVYDRSLDYIYIYIYIGARGFLCDISQPRRMMDGGLAGFQNSSGVGVGGVQPHWKV